MLGDKFPKYITQAYKEIKVSTIEKITIKFKSLESIVARKDFHQITNGFICISCHSNESFAIPLKFFIGESIDFTREYFFITGSSYGYIFNGKQYFIQNKYTHVLNSLIEESSKKLKDPIFINGYETLYSNDTKMFTVCGYKLLEADVQKLLLFVSEKRPDLIKSLRPRQRG